MPELDVDESDCPVDVDGPSWDAAELLDWIGFGVESSANAPVGSRMMRIVAMRRFDMQIL
jgi:hypothetical protein